MIHLAKSIEQSWRHTVEQAASASDTITEIERIHADIRLDCEMGDMALDMLERVMAGEFGNDDPWSIDAAGCYQKELDGVVLVYNPQTHQLMIETQLTESLSTEATASAEACGFTIGEVAVEAISQYYEDGWGGRTKDVALLEAQKKAEEQLSQAIDALHKQQNPDAFHKANVQASQNAQQLANEKLEALKINARIALRNRLQVILASAEERVNHVINRAVGEAYRQTLRKIVLDSGGKVLMDEKTGSIINMELVLN